MDKFVHFYQNNNIKSHSGLKQKIINIEEGSIKKLMRRTKEKDKEMSMTGEKDSISLKS